MPSNFQDGDLIEAGHLKQYSGEAYYSVADGGSTSSAYVATVTPAPLSGYPVGMVINFDLPMEPEDYVHRIVGKVFLS